jgi:hypothetical protein
MHMSEKIKNKISTFETPTGIVIPIFVDEGGVFSATPSDQAKERTASTLVALRAELDDFFEGQKMARRKRPSVDLIRVDLHSGKVESGTYRGYSRKKGDEGYAWKVGKHTEVFPSGPCIVFASDRMDDATKAAKVIREQRAIINESQAMIDEVVIEAGFSKTRTQYGYRGGQDKEVVTAEPFRAPHVALWRTPDVEWLDKTDREFLVDAKLAKKEQKKS